MGQVRERTAQSSHLNRQYKTILDALPLAAALFEPGRTVRVGSALPKGWANLNRQSGPNQNARIMGRTTRNELAKLDTEVR
ncbi:hypothetical protein ACPOL_0738 [Acidisarcina polymorpha]|uniref:Uncharacterized protein n=1 Tax=Acidisarcina polymorpha TaxID=2211140 RepID=A0A2Z5FTD4_9BACT|nr:hypothetical protein ACPOL_0738 [Acidisarcina polymorpha]